MKGDHPISWCQTYQGGRSFYTGLGHTKESYAEPAFRSHVLGGLRYATGQVKADCKPDTDYRPIFNGKTLEGWKQAGPGSSPSVTAPCTPRAAWVSSPTRPRS